MTTLALLRKCVPAIACTSVYLLLMGACTERLGAAFEKDETSGTAEHWVSEATGLVKELSDLANAYSREQPPTTFADLLDNPEKYKDGLNSKGLKESPDRLLWKLWLLTGLPPLAEQPKETVHDYLQRNTLAYREYIAKYAKLSEEALHRVGLSNAVSSIGSPLWYMTLQYLTKRASLTHDCIIDVRTTPHSVLVRCSLNKGAYARMSTALSHWMTVNESRRVWNPNEQTFLPSGGEYLETDDLMKVIVAESGDTD